ncbi:MAG: UDP-N-acetylmuramate dehydrogenase [Deltaproteobacteria bacterium]|nr:UDP-N-acetylmuramate dehydrogenase [Deltaproteobacteria bacterium]
MNDDVKRLKDGIRTIHLMGVGGTGMGSFAGLLKAAGYEVRGSDQGVYPPMSERLVEWGIDVTTPYAPENLEPAPDLVVVGNVIPKINVEATAMREKGLYHRSFPETFGELFLEGRSSVVVAGTHGKTTTTCLLAHCFYHAERDPGFLVGGIPKNTFDADENASCGESFRVGSKTKNTPVVIEGDEYDTAYFDKGPKFLHYRPKFLLGTSLEYDHADIYKNVEEIESRFTQLFALVPEDGCIVLRAGEPHLERALQVTTEAGDLKAAVLRYGRSDEDVKGDLSLDILKEGPDGIDGTLTWHDDDDGEQTFHLPLYGRHNADNAAGAAAILRRAGLSFAEIKAAFASFAGVKRRMEKWAQVGEAVVLDDFAHHPTAVDTTLKGAKAAFGDRPLWALFEPRSATSCRRIFQDDYAQAFDAADEVLLAPPGRQLDPEEALDVVQLADNIQKRTQAPAKAYSSFAEMVARVKEAAPKDVVLLCMSNGAFGGIHQMLVSTLEERS